MLCDTEWTMSIPGPRCPGPLTHADIPAGAAYVVDVELLSEMLGQLLCDEASEHVGRTARRVRNDHSHCSRGIGLRPSEARHGGESSRASGQIQELTAWKLHGVPP